MATEEFERDGYRIFADVLDKQAVARLTDVLTSHKIESDSRAERGSAGLRNILRILDAVRHVANAQEIRSLVEPILGPDSAAVRGIYFDKMPDANWTVPWHQDLTIAVAARIDCPGFGPWSKKAGVWHVQPPAATLAKMMTVRVHLDDCTIENGPVRVVPGSHLCGRGDAKAIADWRRNVPEVACTAPSASALVMRPLLLHASSPAVWPGHRRVLHLEFAAGHLPGGLQWHDWVQPGTMSNRAKSHQGEAID
jgi:ectoine hydroxylase-related dioxygenase (phytanoyl-CoA dioxygenase family)